MHIVQELKLAATQQISHAMFSPFANSEILLYSAPNMYTIQDMVVKMSEKSTSMLKCNGHNVLVDSMNGIVVQNDTMACYFQDANFKEASMHAFPKTMQAIYQENGKLYLFKGTTPMLDVYAWQSDSFVQQVATRPASFMAMQFANGYLLSKEAPFQLSSFSTISSKVLRNVTLANMHRPLQMINKNVFLFLLSFDGEPLQYTLRMHYATSLQEYAKLDLELDTVDPMVAIDDEMYAYVLCKSITTSKYRLDMYNLNSKEKVDSLVFADGTVATHVLASPMFTYVITQNPAKLVKIDKF